MNYTQKVRILIEAGTEYPDASHSMLVTLLDQLVKLSKTNAELDRLLSMALADAVKAESAPLSAVNTTGLTRSIVSLLRDQIRESFTANSLKIVTEGMPGGFFQFAHYGKLDGWFPDLLGAKHAPRNCIRVSATGREVYWVNNGSEFEEVR